MWVDFGNQGPTRANSIELGQIGAEFGAQWPKAVKFEWKLENLPNSARELIEACKDWANSGSMGRSATVAQKMLG